MALGFRPRRRAPALAALFALALTTLVVMLLLPAGAPAQIQASPAHKTHARKAACPAPSASHSRHASRTCRAAKRNGHTHPTAGQRRARHALKGAGTAAPATARRTPAICEDSSTPQRVNGVFTCADGSEPECAGGSTPTLSSDGAMLLCPPAAKAGPETGCEDVSNPECSFGGTAGEAVCEEATPLASGEGSLSCADGGEVACEGDSDAPCETLTAGA
jgi:hypothetical protein